MSNELPEPWGSELSEKGVHSYGDLAAGLGISKGTAHRLVTGATSPTTVQKMADKYFAGDADRVYELRKSTLRGYGPWNPPESVMLLSPRQRAAIEAVIAAMVPDEQREGGGERADGSATNKPADDLTSRRRQRKYPEPTTEAARDDD